MSDQVCRCVRSYVCFAIASAVVAAAVAAAAAAAVVVVVVAVLLLAATLFSLGQTLKQNYS
jgi:hypothetical protein